MPGHGIHGQDLSACSISRRFIHDSLLIVKAISPAEHDLSRQHLFMRVRNSGSLHKETRYEAHCV